MQIGYAQTIIIPSLDRPVYLAGFGTNRRAETIHDELTARALVLRDGAGRTLILCALDLIGFFRPDAQEVIQRVQAQTPEVSDVDIIIASIHNHHGPDTMGLWGADMSHSGVDPQYMAWLKDRIIAAILASLQKLQPASMKFASVHVPGLAKNARNPEIVDDELIVCQFVGRDNISTHVTLMSFPCHPEVLWEHNPHITADYVGYLRAEVERLTGAPCIFFSADLGGMMTPDVKDHSFEEAEFMGKRLAEEGLATLEKVNSNQCSVISFQKKEIQVKLINILFKFAFARKLLPDVRDKRGRVTTEANLLKIGSLWFATIPGELLPKLGMELKAEMRKAGAEVASILGLANDELGYILPVEEFRYPLNPLKPGKHYEETMSISKEMGPAVMKAVRELLEP